MSNDSLGGAPTKRSVTRAGLAFNAFKLLAVIGLIAQFAISPSYDNGLAAVLVATSSLCTLQYLHGTRAFAQLPLSSFALLGLCVTTQWGALIAQSAAWTPLAERLYDPVRTFGNLALFQTCAIAAHWLSRHMRITMAARSAFADRVLQPLGVFRMPSAGDLWVMGSLGFVSQFVAGADSEYAITNKFIAGFSFLAWAPFIIPVLHARIGAAYCNIRRQSVLLALYLFLAVILGFALNYRFILFAGITTALLLWLLLVLGDERPSRVPSLWKTAAAFGIGIAAIGYGAQVVTAMAIAREHRGTASAMMMIRETIATLLDPNAVDLYLAAGAASDRTGTYSESYIANPVVARFVETKFHDNMFFLIQGLRPDELADLSELTAERLWSILPRPVLSAIGAPLEKSGESHSMGDYFHHLKFGEGLGGFKTGSMFAHGLALFSFGFPAVYFLMCLLLFWAWDIHSRSSSSGQVEISPLAMLLAWKLFTYGLVSESLSSTLVHPLRTVWQNIALYVAVFWLSRLILGALQWGVGDRGRTQSEPELPASGR